MTTEVEMWGSEKCKGTGIVPVVEKDIDGNSEVWPDQCECVMEHFWKTQVMNETGEYDDDER